MCGNSERWKSCMNNIRGLLLRLLYLLHGSVTIYVLYVNKDFGGIHMLLFLPVGLLFLESVITLCFGVECHYVWPCGFFYIASIVPMIWILELGLLEERKDASSSNSTVFIPFSSFVTSLISNKNDTGTAIPVSAARQFIEKIKISDENGRRFAELGVIMGLILGRWLTPDALRGKEISALLLSYVGNAADILEVLESLGTEGVAYSKHATIGILGIYTWALLQFTLVTTWEHEDTQEELEEAIRISMARNSKISFAKMDEDTASDYGSCSIPSQSLNENKKAKTTRCCGYYHQDFPQMFVQIFMQDGPFLFLRLALCIRYRIINELHIFFLCKNALVCILLIYRFFALIHEKRIQKKRISMISMGGEEAEAMNGDTVDDDQKDQNKNDVIIPPLDLEDENTNDDDDQNDQDEKNPIVQPSDIAEPSALRQGSVNQALDVEFDNLVQSLQAE